MRADSKDGLTVRLVAHSDPLRDCPPGCLTIRHKARIVHISEVNQGGQAIERQAHKGQRREMDYATD